MKKAAALALAILLLLVAIPAHAQQDEAAEAELAFELGVEFFTAGNYREALVHLLLSNRLAPNRNVTFNIARCYEELGRYEAAYQRYTDYVRVETNPDDRSAAEEALARIAPKVALIRVESTPPGATIYVERRDLGARGVTPRTLAVAPGETRIVTELDGHRPSEGSVKAVTGGMSELDLQLEQIRTEVELYGTPQGAEIREEGSAEILGTLPVTLMLPPGPHTLTISAEGFSDRTREVRAEVDRRVRADASLERLTGKIVVDASERGALIKVDGEAQGFTPAVLEVPIGEHLVVVTRDGFNPNLDRVIVTHDDIVTLDVDLTRAGLLGATVTTATKLQSTAKQTPAVVTVVERDEIAARGYTSVADILRTIPGFYDVYDLATHNIGVRGVNGGARASGNIIKLMIDGQPVPYRPTTGNFYGEELIPIDAIERVEIIRGPASALYGANAFLGVINVITRTDGGNAAVAQGGLINGTAWGTGVTLQGSADQIEGLATIQYADMDRSGLNIADTSPILLRSINPLDGSGNSRRDRALPHSMLGRLTLGEPEKGSGQWTVWGALQRLDVAGEFHDFKPLTHQTRVALRNRTLRVSWKSDLLDAVTVKARATWFDSEPTENDQVGLGRDDKVLLRNVGTQGQGAGLEASSQVGRVQAILGVDYVHENHVLQAYDELLLVDVFDPEGQKLRDAGTVVPGRGHGATETLNNLGVFAQTIVEITEALSATAGIRLDEHNIYARAVSPRLAVVLAPTEEQWFAKLLYGTSFKTPSAEQLYTQSMGPFDILGNEDLEAQFARTVELAAGYGSDHYGEVQANVFFTQVLGLVEYLQHDLNLQAENAVDEDVAGAEVEGRLHPTPWFTTKVGIGVAGLTRQQLDEEQFALFALDELPPSFPSYQAHVLAEFRIPSPDIRIAPEVSFVGARSASQSNTVQAFGTYELPAYILVSASAAAPNLDLIPGYPTGVSLRVSNLLDAELSEPGFNGIDYPVIGRVGWLTLNQSF